MLKWKGIQKENYAALVTETFPSIKVFQKDYEKAYTALITETLAHIYVERIVRRTLYCTNN